MATNRRKITLVIIDPQFDFCDPSGALYVKGAENDMARVADMILKHGHKLSALRVTLDSHHLVHIAHPIVHVDRNGNHPSPFTMITAAQYRNGDWQASNPGWQKRIQSYLDTLEQNGRYPFIVWNPHCLIGSTGHSVIPVLRDAIRNGYENLGRPVDWVTKGSHIFTEHYSVVQADVPDPSDPSTQINTRFIQALQDSDEILIAGEALSHCVANSVRDIANQFGPDQVKKFVLLTDASSPVGDLPGSTMFADMANAFVTEMVGKGMRTATTDTFFN